MTVKKIVMKLVWIMASIFIIFYVYMFDYNVGSSPAKNVATRVQIEEILLAVIQNYNECHRWPVDGQHGEFSSLTISNTNSESVFSSEKMRDFLVGDAWGWPFFYTASHDCFVLFSSGPDAKTNTNDDIKGWIDVPDENDAVMDDSCITILGGT